MQDAEPGGVLASIELHKPGNFRWVVLCVWAILCMVPALYYLFEIARTGAVDFFQGPMDPDSWLRLVEVKRWLMPDVGFYDHAVPNTNAPFGGIDSPWTRPVHIFLALLTGVFSLIGAAHPLYLAAACYAPLLAGVMMLALVRIAERLVPQGLSILHAILLLLFSWKLVPNMGQFLPGNADHHGMQITAFYWLVATLLSPHPRRGILVGMLLGLMVWISPEGLLWVGATLLWLGWRSLCVREETPILCHAALALLAVAMLALGIEVPLHRIPHFDALDTLSRVHLVLFLLLAAAVLAWEMLRPVFASHTLQVGVAALLGVAVLGGMAWLQPRFFLGPLGDVSPFIFTDFLPNVEEAEPLMHLPWRKAVLYAGANLMAFLAYAFWRPVGMARSTQQMLLFFTLCVFALTCSQLRFYQYSLAAPMLAIWIVALAAHWHATGRLDRFGQDMRSVLPLSIALLLFAALPLLSLTKPDPRWQPMCGTELYQTIRNGALVRSIGPEASTVLVATNLAPAMQFFTPYRTVAGNYHREGEGLKFVFHAFAEPDIEAFHAMLRARKVNYLVFCDHETPPGSAMHQIALKGQRPGWLKELALPLAFQPKTEAQLQENRGTLRLYRVER